MLSRPRLWLALAGAIATLVVLLPPVGSLARHYVFVQALQFVALAAVVPALVVLGAPWCWTPWYGMRWRRPATVSNTTGRSHRSSTRRAWPSLVGYIAIAVAWRLPVAVNSLVRYPTLTIAEAASLIVTGCALWLVLVDSPPFLPTINRPLRAAFAALPMWIIWANAYIMAFSRTVWFSAFAHRTGHDLGIAADQQIAAALLVTISGLCFVPVVYVCLITWLRETPVSEHELKRVPAANGPTAPPMPRPPRGWRLSR